MIRNSINSWFLCAFRLELLPQSRNTKPELIFMDQIEEVAADVPYKNESSIQIKLKDNIQRIILYNQVSSLNEMNWIEWILMQTFLGSNSAKGVDSIDSSRSQNQPRAPRLNHEQEGWQNLRHWDRND